MLLLPLEIYKFPETSMILNNLNLIPRHKVCVLANSGSVGNKSTKMRYDRHFKMRCSCRPQLWDIYSHHYDIKQPKTLL